VEGGGSGSKTLSRGGGAAESTPGTTPTAGDASLVGRTLLHFHVVERLGEGGMGIVYKAVDEKLRRSVALKVLGGRYLSDDRNKEILFREARSAAALHHPNIASIFELHDETDPPFIVMEHVDGTTLRGKIGAGPIESGEALRIALAMAEGLSRAHKAGVVHRDLKPENVMLTGEGVVKILDFGLAKVATESEPVVLVRSGGDASSSDPAAYGPTVLASSNRTERGRVMGTPAYMAPEQARGESVDARSDVFAFGVVLYEMLAGKSPFVRAEGDPTRWGDAEWTARAPLRGVPPGVAKLVSRCLSADPTDRPVDGGALVRLLVPAPHRGLRRARPWIASAALAVAVAVIAGSLGLWSARSRPAATSDGEGAASAAASRDSRPMAVTDWPAPPSESPAALAAYESGLRAWRDASTMLGQRELERAVALDPKLAAGHLRLAASGADITVGAKRHFLSAMQWRDRLSDRDSDLLDAIALLFREPVDVSSLAEALADLARRRPRDAELAEISASYAVSAGRAPDAEDAARRALELDPRFAEAARMLGVTAMSQGDEAASERWFSRCIEISPMAAACLRSRAAAELPHGEWDGAESDARACIAADPEAFHGYYLLARALAAKHAPIEAVKVPLQQSVDRRAELDRPLWGWYATVSAELMAGDFGAVEKTAQEVRPKLDASSALVDASITSTLLLAYEEMGQRDRVVELVEAYRRRAAAWRYGYGELDALPLALAWLARAGRIPHAVAKSERDAWIASARSRAPAMSFNLWTAAYAEPAETRQEAVEAEQVLPDYPPRMRKDAPLLHTDAYLLGRVHGLAGRWEEALPALEMAARTCERLSTAVEHVRSFLWLGRAREARGDTPGACEAYGHVLDDWGGARPRSVSAEQARARRTALHCP
jgi:serine/threonine-protein kinase